MAELERRRPCLAIELKRPIFQKKLDQLTNREKAALLEVWNHTERDAIQVTQWFKEKGRLSELGNEGYDACNAANHDLDVLATHGFLRICVHYSPYSIFELNPEIKPFVEEWIQAGSSAT